MPSVTKRIFEHDIRYIKSVWGDQLISIQSLLPQEFNENDIINLLKTFYPHEWNFVEEKYKYYSIKDKYLKSKLHRNRYNMPTPINLLKDVSYYKYLLSNKFRKLHFNKYSEDDRMKCQKKLWEKRRTKIDKINKKINKARLKTQQVTPEFLDKLIGLYNRKNTSQKDKVYIVAELKKYYCEKVIQFFFKLNDTELNLQLRHEAYSYLQSLNFSPRLRRQKYMSIHTKNKKKKKYLKEIYAKEQYIIPFSPDELEYRIENSKEQRLKSFDYFISHSSKDGKYVQNLINEENKQNKNIFCDWINDVDYLKRHLICEATLNVIEHRLKQSKALIFVKSDNSINSIWCKYELNYFHELGKPIFFISIDSIKQNKYEINPLDDKWFLDAHYKEIALINGALINR